MVTTFDLLTLPLQSSGGLVPRGTRTEVFNQIYWVFLILGTLVGIVVIGYMVYKAYKYRDDGDEPDEADGIDRPQLGELPQGGGGGKKLFTSFGLSTIIVVSLIAWTYGTLLYVEQPQHDQFNEDGDGALVVGVEGFQFAWDFTYPNGHTETNTLRIPANREIRLEVTSRDVFHNFGIPALKVKSDAIPGHTTDTWFVAEETGEYRAACYELCGAGHSDMNAQVIVMEPGQFQQWYENTSSSNESSGSNESGSGSDDGQHRLEVAG
jgi:cytochrome c oxidase subunit 2